MTRRKPTAKRRRSPHRRLKPIELLRIGREIGKLGYCGTCMGCLVWRDFCDYAEDLRQADIEDEQRRIAGEMRAARRRQAALNRRRQ